MRVLPQRAEHRDMPFSILFGLQSEPYLSRAQRRDGVVDLMLSRQFQASRDDLPPLASWL
jgi:hypothetical protein